MPDVAPPSWGGLTPDQLAHAFSQFPRATALLAPYPWLFTEEDFLQIDAFSNAGAGYNVVVSGTMLSERLEIRPFSFTVNLATNRTLTTSRFPLGVGWLLRLVVSEDLASLDPNGCFVRATVCRGITTNALVLGTLVSGYVGNLGQLFWPDGPTTSSTGGSGLMTVESVSNPAAGAEWSFTSVSRIYGKLIAASALYTASAVAGNRNPRLILDDGTTILFEAPSALAITASQAVQLSWGAGCGGPVTADTGAAISNPLPDDFSLRQGWRVRTSTGGILAGDQWSAIRLTFVEWLT